MNFIDQNQQEDIIHYSQIILTYFFTSNPSHTENCAHNLYYVYTNLLICVQLYITYQKRFGGMKGSNDSPGIEKYKATLDNLFTILVSMLNSCNCLVSMFSQPLGLTLQILKYVSFHKFLVYMASGGPRL